ncbi:MAG: multidrug effflux MFS transporter [Pseudomonadota bacterium]
MSGPRDFRPHSAATTAILVGLIALQPLSTDLYLPALPAIGAALDADVAQLQLTLGVFVLVFALAQLVLGPLSDRFGRRPVLIGSLALYTLASLGCALATSIEGLIAARAFQAAGCCAAAVLGRAIVRDLHEPVRAARRLADMSAAMSVVPAMGPIVGGAVQVWFGWQWTFLLQALCGGALVLALGARLAETNLRRDASALDPVRMLANYRHLLAQRTFLAYAVSAAFLYAGLFVFLSGSPFVLIDLLGVAPDRFGYYFAAVVGGYFIGTRIARRLVLPLGIERMMLTGGGFAMSGGVAMAVLAALGLARSEAWGAAAIVAPMAWLMIGAGVAAPSAQAGAVGPFPHMAGAATALLGFLQMSLAAAVGGVFGRLYDGTALPMALLIALMATAMLASFVALRPRRAAWRDQRSGDA